MTSRTDTDAARAASLQAAASPGTDDTSADDGERLLLPGHPPARLDDSSLALVTAFRRALHMHRQFMARSLGEEDLHPGQAICLSVLARDEGMPQRALAETLHIAPPTLSRMLSSLEKSGLVERRDDDLDQRLTRVHLTAAGREVSGRIRHALADYILPAVAALSDDERRDLARLLGKLTESMASVADRPADETVAADPPGGEA